ncbi:DNA invertase Pin-like site-specific DNA recombinase [Sphingomonas endophytica]|uniref:DNA invertase Pin-like site-specific DNA recombinase n=1 Tax=Sphingomonas endophytica TaxID=869719 RepID=A0A7X0JC81_9SPHN|nr:recombinase family protein [Sphingomonas endophytica]MBB6503771.1 DNA invertase Pin-like site-specific DNA recombinase [Sphingomonas endophytica]
MKTIRCAIYTRKSSDEGLEQSFNSLDAQREACAAYILSQASEGWTELPDVYDDGGLSGGTLERPALRRLLADVAAGRIDTIVVYKVDRLTRSLFDFAKLVETFDRAGTSFVSVTQSFNTTTSMGRLTLNMLLSFAQFEREVTAERIRDKITASKARGMWMGGIPPLGYAPNGRSLSIVEEHAAVIRDLFARHLRLRSVPRLEAELQAERITVPRRTTLSGRPIGGGQFTRGQLYQILKNVIYTGRIAHRGVIHPGQHAAIIDEATFDAARTLLSGNIRGERTRTRAANPSLLAGRIVDTAGEPLLATHAVKGKVRHRYYTSQALRRGESGMRLPAREIEGLVLEHLADFLADPLALAATAGFDLTFDGMAGFHDRCASLGGALADRRSPVLKQLLMRVEVASHEVMLHLDASVLTSLLEATRAPDAPATISLTCAARLTRSGRALRLVQTNDVVSATRPDRSLVGLLVQARRWWAVLRTGEINTTELAKREGVTPSYLTRVVRLAFLAPAVTDAIIAGRQRLGVTVGRLTLGEPFPADWQAQKALLLPAATDRMRQALRS